MPKKYVTEKERILAKLNSQKKYRHKNKRYFQLYGLKRYYNMDYIEYNVFFESQNGCCAICGTHQSLLNKRFAVDHDHKTNKIRGLLCMNCNLLLGRAKDNTEILKKAINYLK